MADRSKNIRAGCLDGIRLLELARYQAGPRCGMVLSDLGAEVIKIEKLGGEGTRKTKPTFNGQSIYFGAYNRGKKSLCLDLRQDAGKAVFFDLLKTADMVLENFRPGTLEKMGLGYEQLTKVKSDIILIRVSGFGQYGPYKDRPSFDSMGQAMSGLMMLTGNQLKKVEPIGTAFSLVDRISALHATIGAVSALYHRKETGEGQIIDVCLMDSALTMVEIPTSYYLSTGNQGGEGGRKSYVAKDGWVSISTGSSKTLNDRVFEMIGQKYTGDTQKAGGSFFARIPALVDWCKERTVAEIYEKLVALGVPVAPVRTTPEVAKDPHLWEREMLVKMDDPYAGEIYVPGLSIKFSKTPGKLGPVATPGQHTEEILSKLLNYDTAKIEELRAQQVI